VDLLLVFGCAFVSGALAWVSPGWVIGTAAAFVLVLRERRRAFALALGAGLLLGFWRARSAIEAHERERVLASARGRCTANARVSSSPIWIHGILRWDAELRDVECDSVLPEGRADFLRARLYGGPADLVRGDEAKVVVQIAPLDRFQNPELGAPEPREARAGVVRSGSAIDVRVLHAGRGPPAWIDHARAHVRVRILATFPARTEPFARALVLGEADLAPEDDAAFRGAGLSHLLAVSGTHLVVTVVALVALLRALFARIVRSGADVGRLAAAIGIPLAWAYASFAGGSGSAVRAAWMLTAALGARAIARHPSAARALGLSLVCGAIVDPLAAFDVSFTLSVAATAGLLVFARPMVAWAKNAPKVVRFVWSTCAASITATLACAPVLATMTPLLPIGGVLANVIAVPIGEIAALPLCLAHALLSTWPAAELGCALAASGALDLLARLAHAFGDSGWSSARVPAPTHGQIAVVAVAFGAIVLARERRRIVVLCACVVALLVLELDAIHAGAPRSALRATFLDVAQGDSAILDLPDGTAIAIDGGGLVGSPVDIGTRVLAPVLRMRRRSDLRFVVLSHPHPDHFGGLATGLHGVRVGALWDTGQGEREGTGGGYAALLRDSKIVLRPRELCGSHAIGGATIEVLAPCPDPSPVRSPNDNSLVLRITYGARAFLFMGDAEHEEEADLVRGNLRADVLKVGHHGSRTSTSPALLDAVRPKFAVISCGVRNRFGHPAPVTLASLAGIQTFRTDQIGAVVAWTDGHAIDVRPARDTQPP
jgi:competence protein ComEC